MTCCYTFSDELRTNLSHKTIFRAIFSLNNDTIRKNDKQRIRLFMKLYQKYL